MEETREEVEKKKCGQAGSDGNNYLRTRRIELRVCQYEFQQIAQHAESAGYSNIAQYLRESGLTRKGIESTSSRQKEKVKWLYELNRIGNFCSGLARMNSDSDELLMMLMQINEMVREIHNKATKSHDGVGN